MLLSNILPVGLAGGDGSRDEHVDSYQCMASGMFPVEGVAFMLLLV